jgi:hypothetical protein
MFIPDPDLDILTILDPGSRRLKGTGSQIRIPDPDPQHWKVPVRYNYGGYGDVIFFFKYRLSRFESIVVSMVRYELFFIK